MPALPDGIIQIANGKVQVDCGADYNLDINKRVNIPINCSISPEQLREMLEDPWPSAGKYALGWVYFGILLLFCTAVFGWYNYWHDKFRTAQYQEDTSNAAADLPPSYYASGMPTSKTYDSTKAFFPPAKALPTHKPRHKLLDPIIRTINSTVAFTRFVVYRPVPSIRLWRLTISFPSPGVLAIITIAVLFSVLYCFLPRPLFFSTMTYGSPPLAIRAGMLSVALLPWIVALASKVNLISYLTGIGSERLIVLHRWGAYICVILAIIHTVPFYWQSAHDPIGFGYFKQYFNQQYYIFTTGIAALVPLLLLFLHSLPILRHKAYEVFALLHIPLSWVFIGTMFWHCQRYITSWSYLYVTVVLMIISLVGRLFYLNWSVPTRPSFMIGEESSVTILPENAVKITIPTQKRWKPGQYAYIRMPGIALMENHPFTIASLCSDDFPSDYGEDYRNMMLVFRPFGGFTKKVLDTATKKGPLKTYRAFIEGPYGGMRRQISSFDQVIFFAGGSGITAITSQLLDLIKRMRAEKAITKTIHVVWAMRRPEIMEWFKEELRICREYAPPDSVRCNFYITSAKRYESFLVGDASAQMNRLSGKFGEKIDEALQGVASKRNSRIMSDMDFSQDMDDGITALPPLHLAPPKFTTTLTPYFPPPPLRTDATVSKDGTRSKHISTLSEVYTESCRSLNEQIQYNQPAKRAKGNQKETTQTVDYGIGFPVEPTRVQKALMRFAFLPTVATKPRLTTRTSTRVKRSKDSTSSDDSGRQLEMPTYSLSDLASKTVSSDVDDGWRVEYGRPDIPFTLRTLAKDFGRRTCVFVCGPPEMRVDVARTVAELQRTIWQHPTREEIYLHTENYAI